MLLLISAIAPVIMIDDKFYGKMLEGLEDVLNTAGDLPLSKIVDMLKSNPDNCKTMLKPYFMEWLS